METRKRKHREEGEDETIPSKKHKPGYGVSYNDLPAEIWLTIINSFDSDNKIVAMRMLDRVSTYLHSIVANESKRLAEEREKIRPKLIEIYKSMDTARKEYKSVLRSKTEKTDNLAFQLDIKKFYDKTKKLKDERKALQDRHDDLSKETKGNSATCAAAKLGYLNCLKYLHETGCEWNEWSCARAAENGHLDCLKYAHQNGCWTQSG